jgi:hypothetical protein
MRLKQGGMIGLPYHHPFFRWKGYRCIIGSNHHWLVHELQNWNASLVSVPGDIDRQIAVLFAVTLQDYDQLINGHDGNLRSSLL